MFNLKLDGPGRVGYARQKIHGAFLGAIPPSRIDIGRGGKLHPASRRIAPASQGMDPGPGVLKLVGG
jgi:hypothetical protein